MSHLETLDRLIVRSVLEITIDQLAIVSGTIQLALPSAQQQQSSKLQAANVHPNTTSRPLEELLLREHKQRQKAKKKMTKKQERDASLRLLGREANYAKMVLEETLDEMGESGTFAALTESVGKSRERNRERDQIGELEHDAREELNTLKESIGHAKQKLESDVLAESMKIAHLKDHLLESRRASKGEEIYTSQLEAVREETWLKDMVRREADLVGERDRLKNELEHEQRITLEVESWLRDRQANLNRLHATWNKRLVDDVAGKVAELEALKEARNVDRRLLVETRQLCIEAEEFIERTSRERELKLAAKERQNLEIRTAIKIQAWWRMTMVRRKLGPYRKKKKPNPNEQLTKKTSTIRR